jgi:hypothetical protein
MTPDIHLMRVIPVVVLLFCATPARAGFGTRSCGAKGSVTSGTSFTITLGCTPTAGDLVPLIVNTGGTATSLTAKDSNNNSFTLTPHSPAVNVSSGKSWALYLLPAPANATSSITVSWTGTDVGAGWAEVISITGGAAGFDNDATTSTTGSGNTLNSSSTTPAGSDEFLMAAANEANGPITAPAAGATLGVWTGAQGGIDAGLTDSDAEFDLSASVATAVQFTDSTSNDQYCAIVMAFTFTASSAGAPSLVSHASGSSTLNSGGHDNVGGANDYTLPLPDGLLAGNCVTFELTAGDNSGTITVTDDEGDTLALANSVDDPTNGRLVQIYYGSLTAGAHAIKASFSAPKKYVSGKIQQWNNTLCKLDSGATASNTGTSSTMSSGALTPTSSGDLLIQYAVNDTSTGASGCPGDFTITSFAAASGWSLADPDTIPGNTGSFVDNGATFYQCIQNASTIQYRVYNSTASITPQITQNGCTSCGYASVAIALLPSTGGTPASPQQILGLSHFLIPNGTATGFSFQYSCQGNLLFFFSTPGVYPTAISDGNGNSWANTGAVASYIVGWYAQNAVCTNSMTITVTLSGSTTDDQGSNFWIYDIAGASSNPFCGSSCDATATGNQTTAGNISGASLSPLSSASGILFGVLGTDFNAVQGITNAGCFFDSVFYSNESYLSSDSQAAFVDNGVGVGHCATSSTSNIQLVYTGKDGSTAAGNWASREDLFQ